MEPSDDRSLDQVIEGMLDSEQQRPVPVGLGRKIKDRLVVVSLIQQERKWFRYTMAGAGILLGTLGMIAMLLVVFRQVVLSGVPGAMGFVDYLVNAARTFPARVVAVLLLAVALPLGVRLFKAIRPVRHS